MREKIQIKNSLRKAMGLLVTCVVLVLQTPVSGAQYILKQAIRPQLLDFEAIQERGYIRVLIPIWDNHQRLPRSGLSADYYRSMIDRFATKEGLTVHWVQVSNHVELLSALTEGYGDIIARNVTVTKERAKNMQFTVPIQQIHEMIIAKKGRYPGGQLTELDGAKVAIPKATAYEDSVSALNNELPGLQLVSVASALAPDALADAIVAEKFDATVLDSLLVQDLLSYRDDIEVIWTLPEKRSLAWAVAKGREQLLARLNSFLTQHSLLRARLDTQSGQWAQIKKTGVLRVITRNSPITYYVWRGELRGFEYDLIKRFAELNQLNLEIVVPPRDVSLNQWLQQGYGDVIAAGWVPTEQRLNAGLMFTRPYNFITENIVSRKREPALTAVSDLHGRAVYVKKSSAYFNTLEQLKKSGIGLRTAMIPEHYSWDDILTAVAEKKFDLALIDSHLLQLELKYRDHLKADLALTEKLGQGFAVKSNAKTLLAKLNQYIKKEYRGLHYNIFRKRYFASENRIRAQVTSRSAKTGQISPFDGLIKPLAKRFQFDWRLIASQMFQESRFNPAAKSPAGALGLMQVLPRTARELGYSELHEPAQSIAAGVQYLAWTRERFDASLAVTERTFFALAAYNAGVGHVRDARRLARQLGLNPDRWFDNVEKAIVLLAKPQYYEKARFGYCRGHEPAAYVRQIYKRYLGYVGAGVKDILAP